LGYDYLSLGPALPELPESYELIPAALAKTENVFFSGVLEVSKASISLPVVRVCAEVIHQAAKVSADGFTNLRFAALANVPANAPFFPAAYHEGSQPAFAIATEAADLAVQAFSQATSLEAASIQLHSSLGSNAQKLELVATKLSRQFSLNFKGIDFTLAPFPQEARSIGAAMEYLGVPAFGLHGSLAASAYLTSLLDQVKFKRVGFNGLMLPVLEDAVLAERAAQGLLSLNELLLYSSVCGTGLDTIPLPGDTSVGQLSAVLLDLAALAIRLDKPLTARLMPILGKKAGDPTGFDFAYFANSRVMDIKAQALGRFLKDEDLVPIQRLSSRS
jgi:uncharacterized protein (UPF0210 family)